MEELSKILIALGVPEESFAPFLLEEKPEDFNATEAIEAIVKERDEFNVTKLTPVIEKEYEARTEKGRYAKIIKPIQARLAKQLKTLGATEDQTKEIEVEGVGIDPKKAIDLIGALKSKAKESGKKDENKALEDALAEVDKYKELASERAEKITTLEASVEEVKVSSKAENDAFIEQFERGNYFTSILGSEAFTNVKKVGNLGKIMEMYMDDAGYDIVRTDDGKGWKPVTAKDKTAAITLDGKNTYKTTEEMLVAVARQNHLFPDHNGGKDRKLGVHERVIDGKTVDRSGASFLEDSFA